MDDGLDGGCEVVEPMRLNCGWRRGRYLRSDVSNAVAGAIVLPRWIKAMVLSRGVMFRSGRTEAISELSCSSVVNDG